MCKINAGKDLYMLYLWLNPFSLFFLEGGIILCNKCDKISSNSAIFYWCYIYIRDPLLTLFFWRCRNYSTSNANQEAKTVTVSSRLNLAVCVCYMLMYRTCLQDKILLLTMSAACCKMKSCFLSMSAATCCKIKSCHD